MSLRQQLISPDEQISPEHLQFLICDFQLNCILSFEHLQALLSLDFIIYAVRSVCKYANGMYVACRLTDHWKALLVPAFLSAHKGIVCVCCFQNIAVRPVTAAYIGEGVQLPQIIADILQISHTAKQSVHKRHDFSARNLTVSTEGTITISGNPAMLCSCLNILCRPVAVAPEPKRLSKPINSGR